LILFEDGVMFTLVCPQPRVRPSFPASQFPFSLYLCLGLILAFSVANTGCALLNSAGATQPIAISASLPVATLGRTYSAAISVSGGTAPYNFTPTVGQLPPGLGMNTHTGSISGTPKSAGSYKFTIFVADQAGNAAGTQTLSITVKPPVVAPAIAVAVSPASVTLAPGGTHQFSAVVSNSSNPAVTWSVSAGTITTMGVFTAPTANAPASIRLTAASKADPSKQGAATISISASTPSSPSSPLTLTSTTLPDATDGVPYTAALHASGGKAPLAWKVASGSLPSGLQLSTDGTIQGLTHQAGTSSFTASVSDASGQGVSHQFSIAVLAANTGNLDGPAELPRVYVKSSLADTPAPGVTHAVDTSAALQTALNSANCGDTIALKAGATFTGGFVLPAKNCDDNHWIIVRTSASDSALPPEGTRVTPCYAGVSSLPGRPALSCSSTTNVLAKLVFPDSGSGPIALADGANHYRLLGLELTRPASSATVYSLVASANGASDHIVYDRMWLHGTAQDETTRGIMLAGSTYTAIVDSFFSDFHCVAISGACGDSQAIAGGLGDRAMGPHKIVNNYLEAAGENIIFGGGEATMTPEDLEIRRNLFFKPLTWLQGQPNFVGGVDGHAFIVKNLFELKNARRVLLEGNVFENSWGGFSQVGFALLLTPKNPGTCSSCLVRDVTIRYSKFSHTGAAMQIGNGLSDTGFAALEGSHYSMHDLVFDDMFYPGCTGCDGMMFQLTTETVAPANFWLHDVSIRHITVASNRAIAGWIIAGPAGQQNFAFQDSIVDSGASANANAGGGAVQCYYGKAVIKGVLDSCWSHYTFSNNVIVGARGGQTWPAGNFAVGSATDVGFVNWSNGIGGDYRLSASSTYKGKASDGTDPGADLDALDAATASVK
jgi:Putative Ig domain